MLADVIFSRHFSVDRDWNLQLNRFLRNTGLFFFFFLTYTSVAASQLADRLKNKTFSQLLSADFRLFGDFLQERQNTGKGTAVSDRKWLPEATPMHCWQDAFSGVIRKLNFFILVDISGEDSGCGRKGMLAFCAHKYAILNKLQISSLLCLFFLFIFFPLSLFLNRCYWPSNLIIQSMFCQRRAGILATLYGHFLEFVSRKMSPNVI